MRKRELHDLKNALYYLFTASLHGSRITAMSFYIFERQSNVNFR